MSKNEINKLKKTGIKYDLRKINIKELIADHFYLHRAWNNLGKESERSDWTEHEILENHVKIVDTLRNKGYSMIPKNNSLDKESKKLEKTVKTLTPSDIPELLKPGGQTAFQGPKETGVIYSICIEEQRQKGKTEEETKQICKPFLEKNKINLVDREIIFSSLKELGSFIKIPDFVSLVGSTVQRKDREPNDIDIVIRYRNKDLILERKIIAQLPKILRKHVHFVYQESGPTSTYVPLFDLVLRPKELKYVEIKENYPFKKMYLDLYQIVPSALEDLSLSALINTHKGLHTLWNETNIDREDIFNAHSLVLNEYKRRKIEHEDVDKLDQIDLELIFNFQDKKEMNLVEDETNSKKVKEALKAHNYYLDLPKGDMKFVYQHHWRGLSEEEAKKIKELEIDKSYSLHGDLRLSMNDHLIGYTIFLGEASENFPDDKFFELKELKKLQVGLKLPQPKAWLTVEGSSAPGEVGSTSEKWSRFFIEDQGTYQQGVKREHFQEFFLNGKKLNGRYIFMFAPVDKIKKVFNEADIEEIFFDDSQEIDLARKIWLVQKPKDQRPYAETHKLEDVINELKTKKQKWLVWASPEIKPKKIDIENYKSETKKIDLE